MRLVFTFEARDRSRFPVHADCDDDRGIRAIADRAIAAAEIAAGGSVRLVGMLGTVIPARRPVH